MNECKFCGRQFNRDKVNQEGFMFNTCCIECDIALEEYYDDNYQDEYSRGDPN